MPFKLVGIALLLGGGTCSAYGEYVRDSERMRRLESLIALVRQLRVSIDRYLTPIAEIFRLCDSSLLDGCLIGVSRRAAGRPRELLELTDALRESEYFGDGGEAMYALAQKLGRSHREDSVRECDECLRELEALRDRLAEELPKKRKARAVMGLCAVSAALIVII